MQVFASVIFPVAAYLCRPLKKKLKQLLPYSKSVLSLSGPLIIGQIGFVLMGATDTIMVGHVSADALAAAGVANAVFFLVMVLSIGIGSVISPMIAQAKSAGNKEEIRKIYTNGWLISVLSGIVLTGMVALLALNFDLFGQKDEVGPQAANFLMLLSLSSLPFSVFFFLKQISDGASEAKYSMVVTIVGLLLNLILCWVLIFGKLSAPAMGLNGAAWATVITRVVMMAMMWAILKYETKFKQLLNFPSKSAFDKIIFLRILKQGVPAGLQYFFEIGAFSGAAIYIGKLGVYQLAAHNVAINLASVTYMIISGVSIAASIKVGDAMGQNKMNKVRKTGIAAILTGLVIMSGFALLFLVLDYPLVRLYTADPNVIHYATGLVMIAGLFQLFDGTQAIGLGILRGASDVKIPTLVTLIAYWGIGVPLGVYLAFHTSYNVYGMWFALLSALLFASIMHTLRFISITRKKN